MELETHRLLNAGTKYVRASDRELRLQKTLRLVAIYDPVAIVLEDWRSAKRLRQRALHPFICDLEASLREVGRQMSFLPAAAVRRLFVPTGARTKVQIARAVAIRYPELIWRVPPERRLWMPEDEQMGVFDAVALALTHIDAAAKVRAP